MKTLYKIPFVLLLSLTMFVCGCKQETHYVETALKPHVESGKLPGVISVLVDETANKQDVAVMGWANVEKKTPISMDQMFMQCSQTKGFCGVTIAMLVEEGKISLDEPVSKYLPEFKEMKVLVKDKKTGKTSLVPAKNQITIRMVMNHTAGFPFEIPSKKVKGWPGLSLRDTAKEAASEPLLFEPGTRTQYSNTGIDIGAAVIEVVTKQPWDVFLKERVLLPLGMKNTTFNPSDEQLKNVISMYKISKNKAPEFTLFNKWMPLPHNGPTVFPSAGAGLWTTANDQLKFYKMLMNLGVGDNGVRIMKEETVKNLLATSTRPEKMEKYSLGLSVQGNGWFGHGGAWNTNCKVNWQTKQLQLWAVQLLNPKDGTWHKDYKKAVDQFFNGNAEKGEDKYVGRMK
ncbi:MAG: beta-lactamase family protein [Opitutales bacterium]|nr:beta-lactamase family protein [Opitutales bacterium]